MKTLGQKDKNILHVAPCTLFFVLGLSYYPPPPPNLPKRGREHNEGLSYLKEPLRFSIRLSVTPKAGGGLRACVWKTYVKG